MIAQNRSFRGLDESFWEYSLTYFFDFTGFESAGLPIGFPSKILILLIRLPLDIQRNSHLDIVCAAFWAIFFVLHELEDVSQAILIRFCAGSLAIKVCS